MQIVINMADDGRITVEAEGQEPYQCESAEECLQYLGQILGAGGAAEAPEAMWEEEAAKRPPQPGMMA